MTRLLRHFAVVGLLLITAFNSALAMDEPEIDHELLEKLRAAVGSADSFEDRYEAEVWLLDKATSLESFIADQDKRIALLKLIHAEATLAGLDPNMVLAVIEVESRFDPYAVSYAGAQGMMQVMPFWKNELGRADDNLINTATNLRYGCTILKYYLDMEKGNMTEALARYNGSYGKYWYPSLVFDAWERNWR